MDFSTDTFIFGKERKMIDREAQKFSHQFRTEKNRYICIGIITAAAAAGISLLLIFA